MRRPVILDGNPFIPDYYRRDTTSLFDETGGNTGNLAFRFALLSHVKNAKLMHWGASVDAIRAAGDIILLPMANQLGKHTDLGSQAQRLRDYGLPIVGIGLGAQAAGFSQDVELTEGTLSWLQLIAERAPSDTANIGVRGAYTADQITHLGWQNSAKIIGCPSNFINTQDDIAAAVAKGFNRPIRRIGVAAGIPYWPQLAKIEQNLAQLVTETGGAYIMQHDLKMLRLARREFAELSAEQFAFYKNYIQPSKTDDEFKGWLEQYAYAFFDVRPWMEFLRRFDFVIGARFHGIMLAIQAGVPAGCIAHDSRTLELCQTMGVPVCHHTDIKEDLTTTNILDYFHFDPAAYRETRRKLAHDYLSILNAAEIEVSRSLENLSL